MSQDQEVAEYQGKKYRKLKSLAPVEVLKDIKTECEKLNFLDYMTINNFFLDCSLNSILKQSDTHTRSQWLPWLIKKGYVEECRDKREEHFRNFDKFYEVNIHWTKREDAITFIWDWFDKNPIPKEGK